MGTFESLSGAAKDEMMQLFVVGPTWDGNLVSKQGRTELIDKGLAFKQEGFQSLTSMGLSVAIGADVSQWADKRWHRKQRQLPPY